ncbi:MAG TPA: DUF4288 domain-containing protein [Opitutaceae bacterium]
MKPEVRTPSPRFSSRRWPRTRFYIAELVQECRVRGIKTSMVWVNIHLIKASSANEAYSKALKKGKEHNARYRAGKDARPARWVFRGIRQLMPIYEKIADGAEIMFETHEGLTPASVKKMVRPRNRLFAIVDEGA